MGFLTPKSSGEDERLPGAAGLNLDVDPKRCPTCRREVTPWEERCRDCGEVPVVSSQLPGQDVPLPPGLRDLADDLDAELAEEAEGAELETGTAGTGPTPTDEDGRGRDG